MEIIRFNYQQIYKFNDYLKQTKFLKYLLYICLILFLYSWSSFVLGQPSDDYALAGFKPAQDDDALSMLGKIAGDVGAMGFFPSSADSTVVGMFKVFNTAVVALGAVLFMWNILSATVNGAHDGEFLGKRYNSYWLPTRTMLGVVLIMPLMGGWSPAQALMGWAAWSGTGIASYISKSETLKINQGIAKSVAGVTVPVPPDADFLINNIFKGFECIVGHSIEQATNQQIDQNSGSNNERWGFKIEKSDKRVGINFGDENTDISSCSQTVYEFNTVSADASQSVKDYNKTFKETITNSVEKVINSSKTQADSIFSNIDFSDPIARQKAADDWDKARKEIRNQFYQDYQNGLKTALDTAYNGMVSEITQDLNTSTWIHTGLAGIQALTKNFQSASANSGTLESVPPSNVSVVDLPKPNKEAAGEDGMWDKLMQFVQPVIDAIKWVGEKIMELQAWGQKVVSLLSWPFTFPEKLGNLLKISIQMGQNSPLGSLQSFGFNVLSLIVDFFALSIVIITGLALLSLGSAAIPFINLAAALNAVITAIISCIFTCCMFLIPLIFFSLKLIAVLPFTPILMWIGALTGYFVIFIESLFGAPLWALTHLETDGEGLGPKTGHGYLFLLNLIFRPSIMIIAFYLATQLLVVMGGFSNGIILGVIDTFINSSANYFLKIMMIIGAIFVWVSLMENLIHTCFSLINTVPQQVFTWIGGQFGSQVGAGISEQVTQGAGGKMTGMSHNAAHIGHSLGGQASKMHGGVREGLNQSKYGGQGQRNAAAKDSDLDKHNEILQALGAQPSKSKYSDGSTWGDRKGNN